MELLKRRPRRRRGAPLALLLLGGLGGLGGGAAAVSAAPRSQEYALKAAFLFNFTKFVDWPPTAFADEKSPLNLCVLGNDDPFETSLDELVANETVNGRPIAVRRLTRGADPGACHVLFIPRTERERQLEVLAGLRGAAVLTVGESERFLADGGLINFFLDLKRIRFEVNLPAVERTPLKISSKLLRLARLMPEPRH